MESKDLKRILAQLEEAITLEIRRAAEELIRESARNNDMTAVNAICDMNNEAVKAVRRVIKEVLE